MFTHPDVTQREYWSAWRESYINLFYLMSHTEFHGGHANFYAWKSSFYRGKFPNSKCILICNNIVHFPKVRPNFGRRRVPLMFYDVNAIGFWTTHKALQISPFKLIYKHFNHSWEERTFAYAFSWWISLSRIPLFMLFPRWINAKQERRGKKYKTSIKAQIITLGASTLRCLLRNFMLVLLS